MVRRSPRAAALETEPRPVSPIGSTRRQLIFLHALVTIALCYQLLFSKDPRLPSWVSRWLV